MGEKEVPIQNIWRTVTEISVTVDVCSGNVKYYILVRGTSEGDKSQSHISSHFAPIEFILQRHSYSAPASILQMFELCLHRLLYIVVV